jgi:hypothetical protein
VRRALAFITAFAVLSVAAFAAPSPSARAAELPRAQTLSRGWEVRGQPAEPAPPQPPPPVEGQPEDVPAEPATPLPRAQAAQSPSRWTEVSVPSVFNPVAVASEYGGSVRR